MTRKPTEWEKIFANNVTDQGYLTYINSSYTSTSKKKRKRNKKTQFKNEQKT